MKKIIFIISFSLYILFTLHVLADSPSESNNNGLTVGQDIPGFNIKMVTSPEVFTKEKLLGQVYLLDFWRTTCKYCCEKMPLLHEINEKYKGQGLIIISISLDKSFQDVEAYQQGQWKMPWYHCVAEDGFQSTLAGQFQVKRIPRMFLVGRYGKILYINEKDNDAELKRILEGIFQ